MIGDPSRLRLTRKPAPWRVLPTFSLTVRRCVYYESIKGDLKISLIYECRCDERLKTQSEESTRLVYTGLVEELEHLKIKTRLFIMNR